ncbi:hypothetical protein AAHA92_22401 [Salvia divinorum]|uniref:Uncharacterized protein n=1 Tax=Salvia divinorum TaxID=28513 RepID=A0ABD1GRI0_SALDI
MKSSDNGLSMKEIQKVLNVKGMQLYSWILYRDHISSTFTVYCIFHLLKTINILSGREKLEVKILVLEAFGRVLKVNAYNSVHMVDSLYRSKYFLTRIDDRVAHHLKSQRKSKDSKPSSLNLDNQRGILAVSEDNINTNDIEGYRVTILNCPIDATDHPSEVTQPK